jgi:hypothetical protein
MSFPDIWGSYARAPEGPFVTARDIIIPAGTEVGVAPWKTERVVPFACAVVGPTKDTTFEWTMPLDEALEQGLVVPSVAKAA